MRELFLDESTLTVDYLLPGGDGAVAKTTPVTPNFSMSSTSAEFGGEEDYSGPCSKKKEKMGEEEKHAEGSEFKKV